VAGVAALVGLLAGCNMRDCGQMCGSRGVVSYAETGGGCEPIRPVCICGVGGTAADGGAR
jgi:hypothetical protein